MSLNLATPLRDAVMGLTDITDLLGTYAGEPSIFTRRPVPGEGTYPMVVISPDIALTDQDALINFRPVIMRDLAIYGQTIRETSELGQQDDYRSIETIGYALREAFHRHREMVSVPDYNVIDIIASGPIPAPTGDDRLLGRVVTLTIRLSKN